MIPFRCIMFLVLGDCSKRRTKSAYPHNYSNTWFQLEAVEVIPFFSVEKHLDMVSHFINSTEYVP